MKIPIRRTLPIVSVLITFLLIVSTAVTQTYDPADWTTGKFKGCSSRGNGKGDPDLSALKNRDIPPDSYKKYTVEDLIAIAPESMVQMRSTHRDNWSPEAEKEVLKMESKGVRIEGYVLAVDDMGPESCNCAGRAGFDMHMWIADEADFNKKKNKLRSMVAEISPRLLPKHSGWNLYQIAKLRNRQIKVRISGWLMWDNEHPSFVGKSRGTIWEIHPVHEIEVRQGNKWVALDEWEGFD